MASEQNEPGLRPQTMPDSGALPEHSHHLESVAQASDLEDRPAPVERSFRNPPASPPPPSDSFDDDDDEGGGPVKTFLEHLEDLRWVIIKSGAAVLIGMIACLVAAPSLVKVLERPVYEASLLHAKRGVVLLRLGTNVLWRLDRDKINWPVTASSGPIDSYQLIPSAEGTNLVMVLQPENVTSDASPNQIAIKNYTPLEPFQVALQIALYGGIGLSSPFVLYFIGEFVVPALKRKEKRLIFPALGVGSALFILGVVFCYFVMLKIALNAAVAFSQWMNFGADEWRADEYLSFVCKFLLGMGLAFELPVVILSLVKIGLLDYERLTKLRPYWIVVNLIISAVITPPDPFSMFAMAVPLQLLYEISVFVARFWKRKATANEPV